MLKHVLTAVLAASILAGCGKSESTSGGGGSSGGGSSGGSSASAKTPEQFYNEMKGALVKGDADALWGMFSSGSKKKFAEQMKQMQGQIKEAPDDALADTAKEFGVTVAELKTGDPEKLAKAMITSQSKKPEEQEKAGKGSFVKADVQGDKAFCETKNHKGEAEFAVLVKEGGDWKFDIDETEKYEKEKKPDNK